MTTAAYWASVSEGNTEIPESQLARVNLGIELANLLAGDTSSHAELAEAMRKVDAYVRSACRDALVTAANLIHEESYDPEIDEIAPRWAWRWLLAEAEEVALPFRPEEGTA